MEIFLRDTLKGEAYSPCRAKIKVKKVLAEGGLLYNKKLLKQRSYIGFHQFWDAIL